MSEPEQESNFADFIKQPTQEVLETEDGVYIDGCKIEFVLTDSVKTRSLGEDAVKVTLSFIAKRFTKEV